MGAVVHCVGVAGIGMCGVAALLLQQGDTVSGSDSGDVDHLGALIERGLVLHTEHRVENLPETASTVVYSAAVPRDNPELIEAQRRGIEVLSYAQMVGRLMNSRRGLCVAGTHGKTTTSSMVAWILRQVGRDPSFIIGAHVPQLDGGAHSGGDDFVLEACEFDRSFHHYTPAAAIVTNIDVDHLDYYADIKEIQESFRVFLQRVEGPVYMPGDDPYSQPLITPRTVTCGFTNQNQIHVVPLSPGVARLREGGRDLGNLALKVPGRHNLINAALAFAMTRDLGVATDQIEAALATFIGAERRFQIIYEDAQYAVVDDYAHHPVEIDAVLQAASERWPKWRRYVVFQPHQHSRTRFLLDSFAWTLGKADRVHVPEIYFVRDSERDRQEVSSQDLARRVRAHGGEAVFVDNLDQLVTEVPSWRELPTVVLVLGAGDIFKVARSLCP